jgi:hypothetical protein
LRSEILFVGGTARVADECLAHTKVYVKGPANDNLIVLSI